MKNCDASVATARYSPRMRRLGRPKTMPTSAAQTSGKRDGEQKRNAVDAQDQIVAGERADRHEARRSQRQLAGIAHQDVLAQRHQRKDSHGIRIALSQ